MWQQYPIMADAETARVNKESAMSAVTEQQALLTRSMVAVQLQEIPLLAGVDARTLDQVAVALKLLTVKRGRYVLHKGSVGDHLLFVLAGQLEVVDLTEDGQEIGLNFLSNGDYFGELSIIDGLPCSTSVVAREDSSLAMLPRNQAHSLIYHNPLVVQRLLSHMASDIRAATNYRAILGIPNAFQRVFALLNQFARTAPGGLVVIEKLPTQQEIAITVNTSRETVSRAIHTLIRQGVVEKDLRRLIVREPEAFHQAVTNASGLAQWRLISCR